MTEEYEGITITYEKYYKKRLPDDLLIIPIEGKVISAKSEPMQEDTNTELAVVDDS